MAAGAHLEADLAEEVAAAIDGGNALLERLVLAVDAALRGVLEVHVHVAAVRRQRLAARLEHRLHTCRSTSEITTSPGAVVWTLEASTGCCTLPMTPFGHVHWIMEDDH